MPELGDVVKKLKQKTATGRDDIINGKYLGCGAKRILVDISIAADTQGIFHLGGKKPTLGLSSKNKKKKKKKKKKKQSQENPRSYRSVGLLRCTEKLL